MFSRKSLVRFALLFSLAFSSFAHASSIASFSDIGGNQNQIAIEWLVHQKVLTGYSDGTFRPDLAINRAELMKILVSSQGIQPDVETHHDCFSDVQTEWFAPFVCYAAEKGWVEGYSEDLFKPEQNVNKAEALKMLVNVLGYDLSHLSPDRSVFSDVDNEAWYAPFVELAHEKELLEQSSGDYGVADTTSRGEISENIYRAMVMDQYGFQQFSNYLSMNSGTELSCDTPVQVYGGIAPTQDEMETLRVSTCKGYRYTACTQDPFGNPDLYGSATVPSLSRYEKASTDGVITSVDDEGNETHIARPDCITFEPDGTQYYLGVFGVEAGSTANIWITNSKLQDVPDGFEESLVWFADGCSELTNEDYGPFNTPWGNDVDSERPFYDGYPNYIHGGSDYACEPDTVVEAMCDGFIADSNDAGGDWGWHTVLECENEGHSLSIALIHLREDSVLPIGTEVRAGDPIGKVFALESIGEVPHVHITGCKGTNSECFAGRFQSARGAARQSEWWGVRNFWFDMDWHTNPGLYAVLPQ